MISTYKGIAQFLAEETGATCEESTARRYAMRDVHRLPVEVVLGKATASPDDLRRWLREERRFPGRRRS